MLYAGSDTLGRRTPKSHPWVLPTLVCLLIMIASLHKSSEFLAAKTLFSGRMPRPTGKLETGANAECVTLSDYGEYCSLTRICIDENGLIANGEVKLNEDDTISKLANFPTSAPKNGAHLPRRAWVQVQTNREKWTELWFTRKAYEVVYVTGFDDPSGANPFHYAESVMPFLSFSLRNEGVRVENAVLYRSKPRSDSWVAGLEAQVFFNTTVQYHTMLREPICAELVVVGGTMINIFEGPYHAELFRTHVYTSLNLFPGIIGSPVRVTMLKRKQRFLKNSLEIEALIRLSGAFLRVETLDELTFSEQVELMAKTDLLISPHGAGLTNVIFMQQERAVIELFPSKLWYYELYGKIARNSGLFYAYVMGKETYPNASSIRDCFATSCAESLKKNFYVDPKEFLPVFLHSLSWLGYTPHPDLLVRV